MLAQTLFLALPSSVVMGWVSQCCQLYVFIRRIRILRVKYVLRTNQSKTAHFYGFCLCYLRDIFSRLNYRRIESTVYQRLSTCEHNDTSVLATMMVVSVTIDAARPTLTLAVSLSAVRGAFSVCEVFNLYFFFCVVRPVASADSSRVASCHLR